MLQEFLKDKEIILASGSPRRQRFFEDLKIPVTIDVRPVKEVYPEYLVDEEITDFLSELKAEAFSKEIKPNQIVITSDTIVAHEGQALGKPKDYDDAVRMLSSLSGKTHVVITSVSFTTEKSQRTVNAKTKVKFKDLTSEEINYYVKNYEPYDKAGAYAIQEWIGLIGIVSIKGSYFNVVGLPTHLVYDTLLDIGRF